MINHYISMDFLFCLIAVFEAIDNYLLEKEEDARNSDQEVDTNYSSSILD